jgi:hypothetical protein
MMSTEVLRDRLSVSEAANTLLRRVSTPSNIVATTLASTRTESKNPRMLPRPERKAARAVVECTVQVSLNLARLMRKCAAAEAGGAPARDALLAAAGVQAGEIETLRDQTRQCAEEFRHAEESAVQLRVALEQEKRIIAQRSKEIIDLRQEIKAAVVKDKDSRQSIEVLEARIGQMQTTITAHKVDLMHTVSTEGLEENAVVAMRKFRDQLCRGDNTKAAALATAGYSLFEVQAALAKQDREDMRAFEALLGRPTWRRRIVLWLLGARAEQ